jgi:hypothetical protein
MTANPRERKDALAYDRDETPQAGLSNTAMLGRRLFGGSQKNGIQDISIKQVSCQQKWSNDGVTGFLEDRLGSIEIYKLLFINVIIGN